MPSDLELLERLLSRMEDSSLDFKRDQYKLESDQQKSDFVKDIVSMANTPRDEPAYIVIGVVDQNGRAGEVVGISGHPDPVTFQNLVNGRTNNQVQLYYREIGYLGSTVGLFEIPVDRSVVPVMAARDIAGLRTGVTYTRRNAQNALADTTEIRRITEWAASGRSDQNYEHGQEFSWESFYRECDGFESARVYIAVLETRTETPSWEEGFGQ